MTFRMADIKLNVGDIFIKSDDGRPFIKLGTGRINDSIIVSDTFADNGLYQAVTSTASSERYAYEEDMCSSNAPAPNPGTGRVINELDIYGDTYLVCRYPNGLVTLIKKPDNDHTTQINSKHDVEEKAPVEPSANEISIEELLFGKDE